MVTSVWPKCFDAVAKPANSSGKLGYSLRGNRKTCKGTNHPDRDAQFRCINDRVKAALDTGEPAISVDTKKIEAKAIVQYAVISIRSSIPQASKCPTKNSTPVLETLAEALIKQRCRLSHLTQSTVFQIHRKRSSGQNEWLRHSRNYSIAWRFGVVQK